MASERSWRSDQQTLSKRGECNSAARPPQAWNFQWRGSPNGWKHTTGILNPATSQHIPHAVLILFSYCKVDSSRSHSPDDDVRALHRSIRTEAKTHPACCVDHQLKCNVALVIIKAPSQTHQAILVQVLHKGKVRRFWCLCSFSPEEHEEERKKRDHDASVSQQAFQMSSIPEKYSSPPSLYTPALLDGLRWW